MSKDIWDMLKKAEEAKQITTQQKNQIPLEMVDADNIPREAPLQYEFLCRIVGSLYIQHHHSLEITEERHGAIINGFKDKIRELMSENAQLKEELNKDVSGDNPAQPQ